MYPPLAVYERLLLTTALEDFAGNEASFAGATRWTEERLRSDGVSLAPYLGCAEYSNGREALAQLRRVFGLGSARAIAQSEEDGTCFIVTASHADAEGVLANPAQLGLRRFGAFPTVMKLAPGLLEFKPEQADEASRLTTTHGHRMRMANVEGLNIEVSPSALPAHDPAANVFTEQLLADLMSSSLDISASSFWSDPALTDQDNGFLAFPEGASRSRQWKRAAHLVHGLTSAAGSTAGKICSWESLALHHPDDDILLVSGEFSSSSAESNGVETIVTMFVRMVAAGRVPVGRRARGSPTGCNGNGLLRPSGTSCWQNFPHSIAVMASSHIFSSDQLARGEEPSRRQKRFCSSSPGRWCC